MSYRRFALLLLFLVLSRTAAAGERTQFEKGEPITLDPAKAYVAVRQIVSPGDYPVSLVLVRLLDPETFRAEASAGRGGRERSRSNVVVSRNDGVYMDSGGEKLFLFSLPPGRYVLAGLAEVNKHSGPMVSCLCMGTVSFRAEPGWITDMGTLLAARDDRPTSIPELAGLVRGRRIGAQPWPSVAALRTPDNSSPLPAPIRSLSVVAADYRAVDKFPNPFGTSVERLAPLAGVLAYDEDRIVDVKGTD